MIEVRRVRFSEVAAQPDFDELLQEYANEAAIAGLPDPRCQVEMYDQMQDHGMIHILAAFDHGRLVGTLVIVAAVSPHYGVMLTTTESFFVRPDDRKSGAGIALLREAERLSVELKSEGLLISTPYGGKLAKVLPKAGYIETNRVFFRSFA